MRKRRTRNHVIADLSANHFEKQVLLCGFTVERTVHDYGVDMLLFTFTDEGEIENETVSIQLKATDNLALLRDEETIAITLDRADLDYWRAERFPVILVVYDAVSDIAYWLHIQSYFLQDRGRNLTMVGNSVTVHIRRTDVVNIEAVRQFANFKAQVLDQLRGVVSYEARHAHVRAARKSTGRSGLSFDAHFRGGRATLGQPRIRCH